MATEIKREPERSRYLLLSEGEQVGVTEYLLRGNAILLTHTEIDPARRGEGLADTMVRGVLDDIHDTTESRVVAACPYVTEWFARNPDYRGLQKRG